MDNKNVFVAIALSMSVLLFWAAFFEEPRPIQKSSSQQEKNDNVITPNINESLKIKTVSREDSINNSKRLKIENNSIIGSLSPLKTAPNQILEFFLSVTLPITAAFGATQKSILSLLIFFSPSE